MSRINGLVWLAGYLHQDWDLDYDTVWDAVRAFKGDIPKADLDVARQEIQQLLDARLDESELKRVLVDELYISYWPPGSGKTFREWLTELARALDDPS